MHPADHPAHLVNQVIDLVAELHQHQVHAEGSVAGHHQVGAKHHRQRGEQVGDIIAGRQGRFEAHALQRAFQHLGVGLAEARENPVTQVEGAHHLETGQQVGHALADPAQAALDRLSHPAQRPGEQAVDHQRGQPAQDNRQGQIPFYIKHQYRRPHALHDHFHQGVKVFLVGLFGGGRVVGQNGQGVAAVVQLVVTQRQALDVLENGLADVGGALDNGRAPQVQDKRGNGSQDNVENDPGHQERSELRFIAAHNGIRNQFEQVGDEQPFGSGQDDAGGQPGDVLAVPGPQQRQQAPQALLFWGISHCDLQLLVPSEGWV